MAYENLKSAIKQAVKQNGNQEITGSTMQSTLLSMVDNIPEVVQEFGTAEDKVISQKVVSSELRGLKGLVLLDGASLADRDVLANFKYFNLYNKDLGEIRIGTVYNTDGFTKRIIVRTATRNWLFDNADEVNTENFSFAYDWSKHSSNINVEFPQAHIKVVHNPSSIIPKKVYNNSDEIQGLNIEVAKKFDKSDVVQEFGTAEDKVISQKTLSNNLTVTEYEPISDSEYTLKEGGFYYRNGEFGPDTTHDYRFLHCLNVKKGENIKITGTTVGPNDTSYGSVIFATAFGNSGTVLKETMPLNKKFEIEYIAPSDGVIMFWPYDNTSIKPNFYRASSVITLKEYVDKLKLDKSDVVQEFGTAEDKVISQKTLSNNLTVTEYEPISDSEYTLKEGGFYYRNGEFGPDTTHDYRFLHCLNVKKGENIKITGTTVGPNDTSYGSVIFATAFGNSGTVLKETMPLNKKFEIEYIAPSDGVIMFWPYDNTSIKPNFYRASSVITLKEYVDKLNEHITDGLKLISPLQNKVMAVLGDSIMMLMNTNKKQANSVSFVDKDGVAYDYSSLTNNSGHLYYGDKPIIVKNSDQSGLDNQNWENLQEKLQLSKLYNFGLGGAEVNERQIITEYPYPDGNGYTTNLPNEVRWMLRRINNNEIQAPDVILIWLGTNGAGNPTSDNFDSIMSLTYSELSDDSHFNDRKTFYGGLRWSLETLYRNLKFSTIVLATPIQTNPENYRTYEKLSITANAIKKMGARYACQVFDALNEINIVDFFENKNGTGYFLYDGLHPNSQGKIVFTNYIATKLMNNIFLKR